MLPPVRNGSGTWFLQTLRQTLQPIWVLELVDFLRAMVSRKPTSRDQRCSDMNGQLKHTKHSPPHTRDRPPPVTSHPTQSDSTACPSTTLQSQQSIISKGVEEACRRRGPTPVPHLSHPVQDPCMHLGWLWAEGRGGSLSILLTLAFANISDVLMVARRHEWFPGKQQPLDRPQTIRHSEINMLTSFVSSEHNTKRPFTAIHVFFKKSAASFFFFFFFFMYIFLDSSSC